MEPMKEIISWEMGDEPEELEVEFSDGSRDQMTISDLVAIYNEFVNRRGGEK